MSVIQRAKKKMAMRLRKIVCLSQITNRIENERKEDYFSELPLELLDHILWYCNSPTLITTMSTNRRFYNVIRHLHMKWKSLNRFDFDVHLSTHGKFESYFEIYKLLYCSRLVLASYTYARYFNNMKLSRPPNWLIHWASLSKQVPMMVYGRHRIKKRVKGHYLKRLNDISYGQIKKVFNMTGYDFINLYPSRIQRGTIYFSYQAVRYAGIRKHESIENYTNFILNKCYRSRGFVMRSYGKVIHTNPLMPL